MSSAKIELYSAWYCPFAQRTWAALEYLDVPYIYKEIDPYEKTESWMELSRGTGQVPVLQITEENRPQIRIPDSLRTMEYLDDISTSKTSLFPSDANDRAEARFWLDQQGRTIIPFFYRFLKADKGSPEEAEAKAQMLDGLKSFTQAMSSSGPYFFANQAGIVDLALAPFALRIELLLANFKDFHLPDTGEHWPRYHTWLQAMKAHPAIIATIPNPESYEAKLLEFYLPYSLGGGQKDVTVVG
ncbi:MAG: glutathione S-transferase family protein [Halopseudomonas aestusnigri]